MYFKFSNTKRKRKRNMVRIWNSIELSSLQTSLTPWFPFSKTESLVMFYQLMSVLVVPLIYKIYHENFRKMKYFCLNIMIILTWNLQCYNHYYCNAIWGRVNLSPCIFVIIVEKQQWHLHWWRDVRILPRER